MPSVKCRHCCAPLHLFLCFHRPDVEGLWPSCARWHTCPADHGPSLRWVCPGRPGWWKLCLDHSCRGGDGDEDESEKQREQNKNELWLFKFIYFIYFFKGMECKGGMPSTNCPKLTRVDTKSQQIIAVIFSASPLLKLRCYWHVCSHHCCSKHMWRKIH